MKIFDGFLFFNELELLEIRLKELYDHVDYFVICESTKTHQNKDKPLFFKENKDRFSEFSKKIIHHVYVPDKYPYSWYIENEQRNQLKSANFKIEQGDIFLLSDGDEIMKGSSVEFLRKTQSQFNEPKTSIMQMSYGYLNAVVQEPWHHKGWRGTIMLPYDYYNAMSLNEWRNYKDQLPRYEDSGWHFSFMGGKERVKTKLASYAHSEFNNEEFSNDKNIENRINNLKDPLGRSDFVLSLEKDLSKFPASSLNFPHLFLNQ
jgi:beta-1,4-mannosyl-glycoprotein beta-1,4-N-acetylglucosaminyltransferase